MTEFRIDNIINGADKKKKEYLFSKILLNSTHLFADLNIFHKADLNEMIELFKIPQFNSDYAFRRKNMAAVYFLNHPLLINELKWTI